MKEPLSLLLVLLNGGILKKNWQKNYELSLELMPKHFEVFPAEGIQIEWPKRLKNRIPGEPEYTFFDPKIHMKGEKHFEDSPWNINS